MPPFAPLRSRARFEMAAATFLTAETLSDWDESAPPLTVHGQLVDESLGSEARTPPPWDEADAAPEPPRAGITFITRMSDHHFQVLLWTISDKIRHGLDPDAIACITAVAAGGDAHNPEHAAVVRALISGLFDDRGRFLDAARRPDFWNAEGYPRGPGYVPWEPMPPYGGDDDELETDLPEDRFRFGAAPVDPAFEAFVAPPANQMEDPVLEWLAGDY